MSDFLIGTYSILIFAFKFFCSMTDIYFHKMCHCKITYISIFNIAMYNETNLSLNY